MEHKENAEYTGLRKRKSWLLIPVVLAMIWCLIPLYVMVVGALKPSVALSLIPADLNPFTNLRLDNFIEVIETSKMGRGFMNSFIISIFTCLITVVVGMMGGYAFAKRSFKGKKIWFVVLMLTMMLPNQVMMIPRYMVAKNLNLTNSLQGVVLTSINSAYAIFLCRQFITSIPDELLGAAKIDGCSEMQSFLHIVLPMSKPVIASLAIFTFIGSWNDFVWQNIMLSSSKLRTVPLTLAFLSQNPDANTLALQFAGATISAIPMLAIFLCFQKYFVKGISSGAVKE